MPHLNIEFKARVRDSNEYEQQLQNLNPVFHGLDHQIDTYFNANHGRLKLREGNIENALIQYERSDYAGAKSSTVTLYNHEPHPALKSILVQQLGVKVVVDKKRKIYFIDNVKFHFDIVEGLGHFIEVEAIANEESHTKAYLQAQCDQYIAFFNIQQDQFIDQSYSDLLLSIDSR